jgi:ribosomal protein S27AE
MDYKDLQPVRLYCNNCGHLCFGYSARDKTARFECGRCGVKLVSRQRLNRITDITLTAPPDYDMTG